MLAPAEFRSLRTSLLPARTARCTGVRPENSNMLFYEQTVNVHKLTCVYFCTVVIMLYRTFSMCQLSYFFYLGMALNFIVVFTSSILHNSRLNFSFRFISSMFSSVLIRVSSFIRQELDLDRTNVLFILKIQAGYIISKGIKH